MNRKQHFKKKQKLKRFGKKRSIRRMSEAMESIQLKKEVKDNLMKSLAESGCFDEDIIDKVMEVFDTTAAHYTFKKAERKMM